MFRIAILSAAAAVAAPAAAQESDAGAAPAVFQQVIDCRTIADSAKRLACFDNSVAALEQATAKKDLFVADRAKVRETKKGLFGLSLPSVKLFGDGDELDEIEGKVAGLSNTSRGKWVFMLEDGARWEQTDTRAIYPEKGDRIRIRRAAMGSFLANVGGSTAFRVSRRLD
jgi:hypothetical protein